jgi:hypothetical protein
MNPVSTAIRDREGIMAAGGEDVKARPLADPFGCRNYL